MPPHHGDLLDHIVVFLQKREGIDKTLKLIRYTSKLLVACTPEAHPTRARLAAFESSVGTSRKALRLGKFLQNVNALRKSSLGGPYFALELVANSGEGAYFFLEQLVWLMKAGLVGKGREQAVSRASGWAELLGYAASIALNLTKIQAMLNQEQLMRQELVSMNKAPNVAAGSEAEVEKQLQRAVYMRRLRTAFVVQDLADSSMAISDLTGGRLHPAVVALAGLVSGSVSFYKNWNA